MPFVFEPLPPVTVSVAKTDARLPVRRVFCVARNYAAHAREMGGDPQRDPPFFFTKWAETVVQTATIPYPSETANFHYEAELVLVIGKAGHAIRSEDARAHLFGYAAGLDMTRRDLQAVAKDKGRPWDIGKNVEYSAPIGTVHRVSDIGYLDRGPIQLRLNGELKQSGDVSDMTWSGEEIVAHVSRYYTLHPGDLIFTGTPEGVGAVKPGDRLEVTVAGLDPLRIQVATS